ncbi:MAG TPA: phosphoribosylformylglycinamidine cyclo-ligase [Bryobacteraceae bacterium]|nr:phosphoribosylformylglycinamidine cyclo-ligase [Bryobacteraceae bacterium]
MAVKKPIAYKDAGVDIDEADRAVSLIRAHARKTFTSSVMTDIGSFGAGFQLKGWKNPVLVSSADGVGTKLKVAFLADKHDTVGECLVNHCVNDIMVQGATPLFFLDYFAVGKLDAKVAGDVVAGIARGCKANGCALIGGETAEMPGMYTDGEYDLAGFIVGGVEKESMLTGANIKAGDVLFGLPSNGLHTNGYSLARKLLFEVGKYKIDGKVPELGSTAAEELLKVHRSYKPAIDVLMDAQLLKGAAHITGGGITDNTPRMLPKGLGAEIHTLSWEVPAVFQLLKKLGSVPDDDWRRTFNLGVGMILCVGAEEAADASELLEKAGEPHFPIGAVVSLKKSAKERVLYV